MVIALPALITIISTVIVVTMASIFWCCWPKKSSGEIEERKFKLINEESTEDKPASPDYSTGKPENGVSREIQSDSQSETRVPLLSPSAIEEYNQDLSDFSAVQRETEILRSYRKPPPPKRARQTRIPRAFKAGTSQDIFTELNDEDSNQGSDKENEDVDSVLLRQDSNKTKRDTRSSMLTEIEQTLAALHMAEQSTPPLAVDMQREDKHTAKFSQDVTKVQSDEIGIAKIKPEIELRNSTGHEDRNRLSQLSLSPEPAGNDSPKGSPIAKPRRPPKVSPKPSPKTRSKLRIHDNTSTSHTALEDSFGDIVADSYIARMPEKQNDANRGSDKVHEVSPPPQPSSQGKDVQLINKGQPPSSEKDVQLINKGQTPSPEKDVQFMNKEQPPSPEKDVQLINKGQTPSPEKDVQLMNKEQPPSPRKDVQLINQGQTPSPEKDVQLMNKEQPPSPRKDVQLSNQGQTPSPEKDVQLKNKEQPGSPEKDVQLINKKEQSQSPGKDIQPGGTSLEVSTVTDNETAADTDSTMSPIISESPSSDSHDNRESTKEQTNDDKTISSSRSNSSSEASASSETTKSSENALCQGVSDTVKEFTKSAITEKREEDSYSGHETKCDGQTIVYNGKKTEDSDHGEEKQNDTEKSTTPDLKDEPAEGVDQQPSPDRESQHGGTHRGRSHETSKQRREASDEKSGKLRRESSDDQTGKGKISKIPVRAGSKPRSSSPKLLRSDESSSPPI